MKRRLGRGLAAAGCTLLILLAALLLPRLMTSNADIPGLTSAERVLLRIWVVDSPGGGQAWLKGQLKAFEKQHPGISTYLRTVSAGELISPDAILPDVVFYMPGDVTTPQSLFLPLSGDVVAQGRSAIREALLRCGRWQTRQYGLPLCYGAWVLAIDSALEPGSAATPAPTTLLGRPAATQPASTAEPGYPLDAAAQADCPLQAPGGAALFTLGLLLEELPPLPEDFGTLTSQEVYSAFQRRACATAMLTTGQEMAFASLTSSGSGFPYRTLAAEEVITDQVWLASITADAPREAALLLSHLTTTDAQKALAAQGLHTIRDDLTLYAAGIAARVEQAARHALSAINAYIPQADAASAAWQFFQGRMTLDEALAPLL